MGFTSWLRTATQSSQGKRATFRPQLEGLEDRWVPAMLKVTNSLDFGKGSLRYELAQANNSGKDTIVIANNIQTIRLSAELLVTSGVTIKGDGVTLTTSYNFGDPWGQSTRVFEINAAKPVIISGLTITDNGGSDLGGAILNHTALTLNNCTITDSQANYGGAVYNAGAMSLIGCTLTNNSAIGYGGGIYNAGTMTVSSCTLSIDSAYGFGSTGGGIYNVGTLSVSTSVFVWSDIYGPYNDGGGNIFSNSQPQIGSITASTNSVTAGDSLTLTATSFVDANPASTITQVFYYGFSSATSGEMGVLGYFTQARSGVWTFTLSTAGLAPGTYSFYAMAMDSYGVYGPAASVTVQVN
jgi:hypothetical protein